MESGEIDFQGLGNELRIAIAANAAGDLATAEGHLLDAELQLFLAQARMGTARTDEEEKAIWSSVVGALDATYEAHCEKIDAKERLRSVE